MSLSQIRDDLLEARKAQTDSIKINLLRTLFSEAANIGKNDGNRETTDEEVEKVVIKFCNNLKETLDFISKGNTVEASKQATVVRELEILQAYLPKQASDDEIKALISEVGNNIGLVMKAMTAKFGKTGYDGKRVKELLTSADKI